MERDDDGEPRLTAEARADVTELKKAEMRQAALAERFRRLASQVPGFLYQYQLWPDGRSAFPFASEGIKDIYGVAPGDVVGDASLVFAVLHPEDLERIKTSIAASAEKLEEWHEVYRVHHPDGRLIWIEGRSKPERQDDGSILWHGYIHDVTARRATEDALGESELRFRQLAQAVEVVFWIRTKDRMLYISPAYETVWGRKCEELYSDPNSFVDAVHPDDRDNVLRMLVKEFGVDGSFDQSYRIVRPDGGVRWIRAISHPVRDEAGVVIRSAGTATDITEIRKAQEALERSNSELEQFAYVVSHDLRQPLRVINSYAQLVARLRGEAVAGDERAYLDFIQDAARRMDQMLTSLLEYSRVGRSGEPLEMRDTKPLVEEALAFLSPGIDECGAMVRIEGEWPTAAVARNEIVRLFQNLIGNAVKYRLPDRRPEIVVNAGRRGREWVFTVTDNGIGVAPSQIGRLFRMFQRLHAQGEYEGAGVGLAICRKIVERHQGRISLASEGEGRGTSIRFTLPVKGEA